MLPQPKDGWACLLHGASPSLAWASAATALALRALAHSWLALMAGKPLGCVALPRLGERHRGLFLTIPARRCAVLGCPSLPLSAKAGAMGSCDTLRPMQARPKLPTGRG
jgi:hypothetical protein